MNRINRVILSLMLIAICAARAEAQWVTGTPTVGVWSGVSTVMPDFGDELSPGFIAGTGVLCPLQVLGRRLLLEGGFNYNRWALDNSDRSFLHGISLGAGALFVQPLKYGFQPYAGITAFGAYYQLTTDKLDIANKVIRPGLAFKAGLFNDIFYGMGTRLGVEYALSPVSSRIFSSITVQMGLTYNYSAYKNRQKVWGPMGKEGPSRADELVRSARYELEKGNIGRAKKMLEEALDIDGTNEEAHRQLDRIVTAEESYVRGRDLASQQKYYDALLPLEEAATLIPDAAAELQRVREALRPTVPALEKDGIAAYEAKDYDRCIALMSRVLRIDPENKTARMYLTRAQMRKEALQKL
jgi:tetratricopeptide (TPR) repeat protein